MPSTSSSIEALVAELAPLAGSRLQRVDVVDERELVLELRVPGRTLRLLASARAGAARLHLLDARPERVIPPGPLQAFLRSRLVGERLARLEVERRTLRFVFERHTLELDLRGGRKALLVTAGGSPAPEATPSEALASFPLSEAAARFHAARAPEVEDARVRSLLERGLMAERKRLARLEHNLAGDLARLERFSEEGHRGELLKTVLHQVRRGATSFRAFDWLRGEEVEASLDPTLGPQENLQRFFDRAKKAARGRPRVEARLEEVWGRLEGIDRRLEAIRSAGGEALRALALESEVSVEGFDLRSKGASKAGAKSPIDEVSRRFEAADGTEIRVGRGAKENDRLTFSFAKGDDLWLHVRGTSGAHVILRVPPGKQASSEALIDAAHLAVHCSSQRSELKAEVMVAEVRHVKKTKGAPPGLVGVSDSRTLLVRMEPERITRLYGHREP